MIVQLTFYVVVPGVWASDVIMTSEPEHLNLVGTPRAGRVVTSHHRTMKSQEKKKIQTPKRSEFVAGLHYCRGS